MSDLKRLIDGLPIKITPDGAVIDQSDPWSQIHLQEAFADAGTSTLGKVGIRVLLELLDELAPDKNCVTLGDGSCVGAWCVHDSAPWEPGMVLVGQTSGRLLRLDEFLRPQGRTQWWKATYIDEPSVAHEVPLLPNGWKVHRRPQEFHGPNKETGEEGDWFECENHKGPKRCQKVNAYGDPFDGDVHHPREYCRHVPPPRQLNFAVQASAAADLALAASRASAAVHDELLELWEPNAVIARIDDKTVTHRLDRFVKKDSELVTWWSTVLTGPSAGEQAIAIYDHRLWQVVRRPGDFRRYDWFQWRHGIYSHVGRVLKMSDDKKWIYDSTKDEYPAEECRRCPPPTAEKDSFAAVESEKYVKINYPNESDKDFIRMIRHAVEFGVSRGASR